MGFLKLSLLFLILSCSLSTFAQSLDDPDIRNYFLSDSASFTVRECFAKATKKLPAACKITTFHVRTSLGKLEVDLKESYVLNDRWTTYNLSVQLAHINFYDSKIVPVEYMDENLQPQTYYRVELVTKNKYNDVTSIYDNNLLGKETKKYSNLSFSCATKEQAEKIIAFLKEVTLPAK